MIWCGFCVAGYPSHEFSRFRPSDCLPVPLGAGERVSGRVELRCRLALNHDTRGRTAVQPELQKRRGAGEEPKEASELAKSPGSAKKQSCGNEGNRRGRQFAAWKPPYPSHLDLSIEDSRQ
ncbi:uncharacterized protein ACIBXB_016153 [Morphnus guianensis]